MKLLHNDVAIEPDKPEEKTTSGILIREQIASYPPIGTIRHLGPTISNIKVGDRVVFKQYGGTFVEKDLIIVNYDAVLALV